MGLVDRLDALWDAGPTPTVEDINGALWGACAGGQLAAAQFLVVRGANVNWVSPWDHLTPLEAARRSRDEDAGRELPDRQTDREFGSVVEWLERQ
jgi:hypothetical protein